MYDQTGIVFRNTHPHARLRPQWRLDYSMGDRPALTNFLVRSSHPGGGFYAAIRTAEPHEVALIEQAAMDGFLPELSIKP